MMSNGDFKPQFDFTINIPSILIIVGWISYTVWIAAGLTTRTEFLERASLKQDSQIGQIINNQASRGERIARLEEGQAAIQRGIDQIIKKLENFAGSSQ